MRLARYLADDDDEDEVGEVLEDDRADLEYQEDGCDKDDVTVESEKDNVLLAEPYSTKTRAKVKSRLLPFIC